MKKARIERALDLACSENLELKEQIVSLNKMILELYAVMKSDDEYKDKVQLTIDMSNFKQEK